MPWVTSAVFERMPAKEKIQVGEVNSWRMEPTIERISAVTLRVANMMKSVRSFRWRDYAHSGKKKVMTVSAHEFLRRFLLHVLPGGLVRIRHFGLFANRRRRAALERCRALLGTAACVDPAEAPNLSPFSTTSVRTRAGFPPTFMRLWPSCTIAGASAIPKSPPATLTQALPNREKQSLSAIPATISARREGCTKTS